MSDITVESTTQLIEVTPSVQLIEVDPVTSETIVVTSGISSVGVINAGPVGPRGFSGDLDAIALLDQMDVKVATHNQQVSPVHDQATSGRDFAALFQNGLI